MKKLKKDIETILDQYSDWSAYSFNPEKYPIEPKSKMFQVKAVEKLQELFLKNYKRKIVVEHTCKGN